MNQNMDQFVPFVVSQDTHKRMQVYEQISAYLKDINTSMQCDEMDRMIDGLVSWINSSNYKISLMGIEIVSLLIDRLGANFKSHVSSVLPATVDRLGDSKDVVREEAGDLIIKLMNRTSPQYVFDKCATAFSHKLWKVREEILICLQKTLSVYGAKALKISPLMPGICRLVDDGNGQVREAAIATIVDIYRHVGEKIRNEVSRRDMNPNKLKTILERMDEAKSTGDVMWDDMESMSSASISSSTHSMNPPKTSTLPRRPAGSIGGSTGTLPRRSASSARGRSSAAAGAVDEESFELAYVDVPQVALFSGRDLNEHISKIKETLNDVNKDWEKRVEMLKAVRSLIVAGAQHYEEFPAALRVLEPCLQLSAKDLRSQIVREACVTIAYISKCLGNKADHFVEVLTPILVNLIPNTVKVMATSGLVCIRICMKHTHSHKLIPIVGGHFSTKSSIIRKECWKIMEDILEYWPPHIIEKHVGLLQESIRKGISDADAEARASARRCFMNFQKHFPAQAESLLRSLDPAKRKQLQGELTRSSSNSSLNAERSSGTLRRGSATRNDHSGTIGSRMKKNSLTGVDRGRGYGLSTLERNKSSNKVSQSQPGSRSTSPHRHNSMTQSTHIPNSASSGRIRRTNIPRSQGASREGSREASPSRNGTTNLAYSRERKNGGSFRRTASSGRYPSAATRSGVMAQRVLSAGPDSERALADALGSSLQKLKIDDDAGSDTSSLHSERTVSRRPMEEMQEVFASMNSGMWTERKDGLQSLQAHLKAGKALSRGEVKRITEIFTRMFHDPHSKVLNIFYEALQEFIIHHHAEVHDWLQICLPRLLTKLGSEHSMQSLQTRVQNAIDVVRDSFPYGLQFNIAARFVVDSTQCPNIKVRHALLVYMNSLAVTMDPCEFINSSDTRLAVSRVVTWCTEPKSVEVRKASQGLLISLFNLNTAEFSMLLTALPKTFQDNATRILHNHIRTYSQDSEPFAPHNAISPRKLSASFRSPSQPRKGSTDTENMNPEDIYNSIKQTTADIQQWTTPVDDFKKDHRETTSQDSGIQGSLQDIRGHSPDRKADSSHYYNPTHYQDMNTLDLSYHRKGSTDNVLDLDNDIFGDDFPLDHMDTISEILAEMSNHNERETERTGAMQRLIRLTRDGSADMWDEHFKTILLLLLETLGDNSPTIRALALRTLREVLRHQPQRFHDYAELTILKILEAHKDGSREVSRIAEECASTLASSVASEKAFQVLVPLVKTAEFPVNLAAIKMQTKVVERTEIGVLKNHLADIVPGCIIGYDHEQSPVRKASVFCLVAIYLTCGEDMQPYIKELSGSKMKLLNLYIRRAVAQRDTGTSAGTSHTSSPANSDVTM